MDESARLLAHVEALMREVKEFRAEMASRDSRDTEELSRLRKDAADLEGLRKRAADRRKRNRTEWKSRDSAATSVASRDSLATDAKPAELHGTMSRDSRETPPPMQVVKALSSSQDLDQLRKEKDLTPHHSRPATVARQAKAKVSVVMVKAAYSQAYLDRYHVKPAWNATVAGQFVHLVGRLGEEEAAQVAAFYVGHPDGQYVRSRHPVSLLLRDYERLRTDWLRREQLTGTEARQQEKTAANMGGWERMLKREPDAVG